jgi:hypothetical protein
MLGERSANPRWAVWPFQMVLPLVFALACVRHALFALYPGLGPRSAAGGAESGASGSDTAEPV